MVQYVALLMFRTRKAAEEFVKDDPFVLRGAAGSWLIRGWHESGVEL
jgi:hypothetical protein